VGDLEVVDVGFGVGVVGFTGRGTIMGLRVVAKFEVAAGNGLGVNIGKKLVILGYIYY
jgi:hypothetical protein